MTRARQAAARRATAGLALAIAVAGCGSSAERPAAPHPPRPVSLSLATSLTSAGTAWATIPMGAPSGPNQFWQLFTLTGPGGRWSLKTPGGVATNGALVLAGPGKQTLTAGIRPSLDLGFSPVTTTRDGGGSWSSLPPDPGFADVPDALAATAGGRLIALGLRQAVQVVGPQQAGWTTLTTGKALAATAAGRRCALAGFTAVAYTPAGSPLLAGTCGRPGTVGIFAHKDGTWQLAGPALPAVLNGQPVRVIRLSQAGVRDVALLQAGTGASASLLAAWTGDGQAWTLSPPSGLSGSHPVSASFGADGSVAVVLSGGRGVTLAGPGAAWRRLPPLPAGQAVVLALPAPGTTDLLAAAGSMLTAWRLTAQPARWTRTQTIKVPIPYGSSSGS
ncbi:MAG TPA: hypothetical protein VH480_06600 [Streptosporangiaceae bacterium]